MSGIILSNKFTALNRARSLISQSRSKYICVAASLTEQLERVRTQYSSASYRVSTLASFPVASSIADLPTDLMEDLYTSVVKAMDAVEILRETTTVLLKTIHINIDESVLTTTMQSTHPTTSSYVQDIVERELSEVCDTYETARQLIVHEMEDCDRLVKLALSGLEAADEDEVLFSARGELVTASRSSLLRTEGTYFYGLLNRGSWLTDAIGAHPIDDDPAILKLVIGSLVDNSLYRIYMRQMNSCTRDSLAARLDYYQAPVSIISDMKVHHSIEAVYDSSIHNKVTLTKLNDERYYTGGVWDSSISRYSVIVEASTCMCFFVGFAPSKLFSGYGSNHKSCGWYLYLLSGNLYAQEGVSKKIYTSRTKLGEVITCIYNASSREISFERDGINLGVAYRNIIGEDIAPAVNLWISGDRLTVFAC